MSERPKVLSEALDSFEAAWTTGEYQHHEAAPTVQRVIADLRRLRGDSWLERAAAEIEREDYDPKLIGVLDILKRHRDAR